MTEVFNRYLRLLGIQHEKTCYAELRRIVRAHLTRIPFENISKLFYHRVEGLQQIPGLPRYLDGIERYRFGGTCYTLNYHLYSLLRSLGYRATLCGAGMNQPDAHMVILVNCEGKEYLVDAGYAAPFLEPLPRFLGYDYRITLGTDEYVLSSKDNKGRSKLTLYRDGSPRHGYLVDPRPRQIEDFRPVISESLLPGATFMNCVLLVRFETDYSMVLHNLTITESRGQRVIRKVLKSTDELVPAIEKHFGIPPAVSETALEGLSFARDAWS